MLAGHAAPRRPSTCRASSPTTSRRWSPARAATRRCSTARATCRRDMRVPAHRRGRALARHRGGGADAAASATSRCTRSAARSRSTTVGAQRAILSLIGPAAPRGRLGGPLGPEHAPPRGRDRRCQRPRGRHRPRRRPDRRRRRRRGALREALLRRGRRGGRRGGGRDRPGRERAPTLRARDEHGDDARRRRGSTSAPSASRRAATSARRRSPACTTGASRTATCAGCGSAAPAERRRPRSRLGERELVGSIGTACLSPALGPIAPGDRAPRGRAGRHGRRSADGSTTAEVVELALLIERAPARKAGSRHSPPSSRRDPRGLGGGRYRPTAR